MFGIFKWYFYDNIFSLAVLWWRVYLYVYTRVCVCVRASVARISFYLLRHSIMLRWSYIIHLPLVWRQHTNTNRNTLDTRTHNINKSPYWIIILDFTLFSFFSLLLLLLLLLFPSIRRISNMRRLPLWMPSRWPIVYRPPPPSSPPPPALPRLPFFAFLTFGFCQCIQWTEGDDLVKPYPANQFRILRSFVRVEISFSAGQDIIKLYFGWKTRYEFE